MASRCPFPFSSSLAGRHAGTRSLQVSHASKRHHPHQRDRPVRPMAYHALRRIPLSKRADQGALDGVPGQARRRQRQLLFHSAWTRLHVGRRDFEHGAIPVPIDWLTNSIPCLLNILILMHSNKFHWDVTSKKDCFHLAEMWTFIKRTVTWIRVHRYLQY